MFIRWGDGYLPLDKNMLWCSDSPVLEGIVNNGLQHQPVANVRRATKVEHVYAPQGRMGITQTTMEEKEEQMLNI